MATFAALTVPQTLSRASPALISGMPTPVFATTAVTAFRLAPRLFLLCVLIVETWPALILMPSFVRASAISLFPSRVLVFLEFGQDVRR